MDVGHVHQCGTEVGIDGIGWKYPGRAMLKAPSVLIIIHADNVDNKDNDNYEDNDIYKGGGRNGSSTEEGLQCSCNRP